MQLSSLGEFGLISRIADIARCEDPAVLCGIGDDCAVLDTGGPERLLVTTDAMVEGRHYRLDWLSPHEVGRRAADAAASDIAAMGGQPRFACASVGLPRDWPVARAEAVFDGLVSRLTAHGACLVGGDCVSCFEHSFIDLVVLGTCAQPWLRSGARPGDVVAVSGSLGGSAAAIAAQMAKMAGIPCWERYAAPVARTEEAVAWHKAGGVQAAIDISDGLVQDAGHIATQSGVQIILHAWKLPVDTGAIEVGQRLNEDPLNWALGGGEDFELLVVASKDRLSALQAASATPLTVIGEVAAGSGVRVVNADGTPLAPMRSGWDHFG